MRHRKEAPFTSVRYTDSYFCYCLFPCKALWHVYCESSFFFSLDRQPMWLRVHYTNTHKQITHTRTHTHACTLTHTHKIALSRRKFICKYICKYINFFVYVVGAFVIMLFRELVCNYLCCCLQFAFYYSVCIYWI